MKRSLSNRRVSYRYLNWGDVFLCSDTAWSLIVSAFHLPTCPLFVKRCQKTSSMNIKTKCIQLPRRCYLTYPHSPAFPVKFNNCRKSNSDSHPSHIFVVCSSTLTVARVTVKVTLQGSRADVSLATDSQGPVLYVLYPGKTSACYCGVLTAWIVNSRVIDVTIDRFYMFPSTEMIVLHCVNNSSWYFNIWRRCKQNTMCGVRKSVKHM